MPNIKTARFLWVYYLESYVKNKNMFELEIPSL